MSIFKFVDDSDLLGKVMGVDTRKALINVASKDLRKAHVGGLVALKTDGGIEDWLIALVDKVNLSIIQGSDEKSDDFKMVAHEKNLVQVVLVGTLKAKEGIVSNKFSRSLLDFPLINSLCYVLGGENLSHLMTIISESSQDKESLCIGQYTLDPKASAFIDGNKLFQRHAALMGSTGTGKSWTVAKILECASELPSTNILLFDLHGEYKNLSYAKQLKIAGPDDINCTDPNILFLPYWLMNAEEMQTMFIDRSEFSAHNQVMAFQEEVKKAKKDFLSALGKTDILKSFTIDSPIPFPLSTVISGLNNLNEEMEQGSRGLKQGKFYGQFSRLLVRLDSRLNDKRYGFLFQAPEAFLKYQSLYTIGEALMGFSHRDKEKNQVKIIDFSEVPSEILPVIVGLVARLVYQLQFWMDQTTRHPLVFFCDEAHLYLPRNNNNLNPFQERALENFEKIAKEGRKYGVGLFVVSQRPSDVSDTILSQCNNFISLRLTNFQDQSTVRKLLPDSMEGFADVLPILDIGEAIIVGDAVLLPTRVKLSPPEIKPLSATINFWDEWRKPNLSSNITQASENMRKQSRK